MKISGCTIFHCPDSIISGDIIELKLLFCDLPLASKKMMRIGEYMLILTVFVTSSIVTFCFLPTYLSTFFPLHPLKNMLMVLSLDLRRF